MPGGSKRRADQLLVEQGLCPSREKARAAIMAGLVYCGDRQVSKPGTSLASDARLELKGDPLPYVSRGGLKLEKALDHFSLEVDGKRALDVGASTGGFTDCLLQRGATEVVSVDVGRGQLAWKLRQDPRVTVVERTNARYLDLEQIGGRRVDLVVVDVSFISLSKILPALGQLLESQAPVVCLVKPQFEAGRKQVQRGGVVRDPEIHLRVLESVTGEAFRLGFRLDGLTWSPLMGPAGNIEYLACFRAKEVNKEYAAPSPALLRDTVQSAHREMVV